MRAPHALKTRGITRCPARRIWCAFLCAIASGVAAGETRTLTLNSAAETPFTTAAGDGFLDIIMGEAFRRAGVSLTLIHVPAERGLMNANAGIEDGDIFRIDGLEETYANLVRVPEKIIDVEFVALTRRPAMTIAGWTSLETYEIGYVKGWKIYEQNLTAKTSRIAADTPEQLFTMLAKNRIDIALYSSSLGLAIAHEMHIDDIRVVEPPFAVRGMYTYLHKRHAALVPSIAAALHALKMEGEYKRVCLEKIAPYSSATAICETK